MCSINIVLICQMPMLCHWNAVCWHLLPTERFRILVLCPQTWAVDLLTTKADSGFSKYISCGKSKVNCTLVQALRLPTGRTVHRGSRGIALPFIDYGTRRGWGVSDTSRPLFTPGKDPVLIVQVVGWAPGPVWTGAENLAPTGIRSSDRSCGSFCV